MFNYDDPNIKRAMTRSEMFIEEQLMMQQKTLDVLVEIRDLLKPKTVEEVNVELKNVLTKTPTASKARGKKEVK